MDNTRRVELHLAFVWDCDDCGRENFTRSITKEISEEEKQEMCERYGIDDLPPGVLMSAPEVVVCKHCGSEFETIRRSIEE